MNPGLDFFIHFICPLSFIYPPVLVSIFSLHCLRSKLFWSWGYKTFSCSTQLSIRFIRLINAKMPTIVGILTFISMINKTSQSLKARKVFIFLHFGFYQQLKFHSQLSWAQKSFITLRPGSEHKIFQIFCHVLFLVFIRCQYPAGGLLWYFHVVGYGHFLGFKIFIFNIFFFFFF